MLGSHGYVMGVTCLSFASIRLVLSLYVLLSIRLVYLPVELGLPEIWSEAGSLASFVGPAEWSVVCHPVFEVLAKFVFAKVGKAVIRCFATP